MADKNQISIRYWCIEMSGIKSMPDRLRTDAQHGLCFIDCPFLLQRNNATSGAMRQSPITDCTLRVCANPPYGFKNVSCGSGYCAGIGLIPM